MVKNDIWNIKNMTILTFPMPNFNLVIPNFTFLSQAWT